MNNSLESVAHTLHKLNSPYFKILYNRSYQNASFKNAMLPNGLPNYTQNCYINCLLQALASTPEIIHLLQFLRKISQKIETYSQIDEFDNIEGLYFSVALLEAIERINGKIPKSFLSCHIESYDFSSTRTPNFPVISANARREKRQISSQSLLDKINSMLESDYQQDAHEIFIYIMALISKTIKEFSDFKRIRELSYKIYDQEKGYIVSPKMLIDRIRMDCALDWNNSPRLQLLLNQKAKNLIMGQLCSGSKSKNKQIETEETEVTFLNSTIYKFNEEIQVKCTSSNSRLQGTHEFFFKPPYFNFGEELSGLMLNWTRCLNCNFLSFSIPNNFSTLEVPLFPSSNKNEANLFSLIKLAFEPEIVENVVCDNCSFKKSLEESEEKILNCIKTMEFSPPSFNLDKSIKSITSALVIPHLYPLLRVKYWLMIFQHVQMSQDYEEFSSIQSDFLSTLEGGKMDFSKIIRIMKFSDKLKKTLRKFQPEFSELKTAKVKYSKLLRFPSVLAIHLQRNYFDERGRILKNYSHVQFEDFYNFKSLKFSFENLEETVIQSKSSPETVYKLCSVIEHIGSSESGHFVCYRKWNQSNCEYSNLQMKAIVNLLDLIAQKPRKWFSEQIYGPLDEEHQSPETSDPRNSDYVFTSDEKVMWVSNSQMMKCSAYLLLYQRAM